MEITRWRPPSFLWIVLIVCGCFLFIFNVLEIKTYSAGSTYLSQPKAKALVFTQDMEMKGYFVKTPGCSIPEMNAMDYSIKKYIFKEDEVICNNGTPPLINSNITSLYLIEPSMNFYNINDTELLNCCYVPFHRQNPKGKNNDNVIEFDKSCREFKSSVDITAEFVKVICSYNNTEIYKDFFAFVPLKNTTKVESTTNNRLNVLVIGIDAVSRLNLHRQMPFTVKFLNNIKAVEMLGYNKVGDNTFPNLIPVLTGLTEDELKLNCWPTQSSYFDKCPFLWKKFKDAGYVTAFGEDSAWMGLFYYTKRGFKNQPTDYFWDHFDRTAESQIGNMHRLNVDQCVGSRPVYKVFLDYITKFSVTMHNDKNQKPYFGFFWGSSLSHDFLNKPKLGDTDYADMFDLFNKTGILNNTALILMSDHGIRWGDIRSTYQGRMEERLPFLYIGLPDWYINQNSVLINNLKTNKRRLTTPFDLHETLLDLLNSHNLTNNFITLRTSESGNKRGYSLFDHISTNRTCADADISSHWCTCQSSKKVDTDDPLVIEAANFTINEHINNKLLGYADCAVLDLDEILDASLQISNQELLKTHYSQDYTISFKTNPGGAIFEATVRRYVSAENYHFNITGTVSRINLYGKQSLCITDFHLKLYCYCKQYRPED